MSDELERVMVHLGQLKQRLFGTPPIAIQGDYSRWVRMLSEYANADITTVTLPKGSTIKPFGSFGDLHCEWHCAPSAETAHRILFIHGGWNLTDLSGYRAFACRLSEVTGCCVLAVDYRHGVNHPHPAALADCVAAYSVALVRGPDTKDSAEKIFIAGDGSGATLALTTTLALQQRGLRLPSGIIALSPLTDWSADANVWRKTNTSDPFLTVDLLEISKSVYLGDKVNPDDTAVSPLKAKFKDFPPLLVQSGECEGLLDDALHLSERAEASGVDVRLTVYPGMPHAFQLFTPFLPEANEAMKQIADFTHDVMQPKVKSADVIRLAPDVSTQGSGVE